MSWQRCKLAVAPILCAVLGACALGPTKPALVIPRPEPPPILVEPLARTAALGHPWTRMVADFALDDCSNEPLINATEALYTRYPQHFESTLKRAMPLMVYVEKQLHAAGIPGEFVMLPMLESSYVLTNRNPHSSASGMWQFMARTARLRGLKIGHHYDGRLDPIASTHAAIAMLTSLHQRFGDWRLVDLAYNAGPYAVQQAQKSHPEIGTAAIPDLPLGKAAIKHLATLMALSCILREPQRFHVDLPQPTSDDFLTVVRVPAGTRIATAADMAEIPEASLRALNPGYRGRTIPAHSPGKLLLPVTAAESLADALAVNGSQMVARVDAGADASDADASLAAPDLQSASGEPPPSSGPRIHKVRTGDTLWSIAQRHHVSVGDLKRRNHLHSDVVHPGQVLRVGN